MVDERAESAYKTARARVLEKLESTGLPVPAKPRDYGSEYDFPADATSLTSTMIGQLRSRLVGWHGYATHLLALADVDYGLLANRFEIALGYKMAALAAGDMKNQLKDVLRAAALKSDPVLERAVNELAERAAYVKFLKAQISIFETQAQALSREQSRRSDELRQRGQG